MKLSLKMPLAFAAVLLLVAAAALYGVRGLNQALSTYATDVVESNDNARAVDDVRVAFKTQVQEWKDTLLRGKKAEDLNKHWTAFAAQEHEVVDRVQKLQAALPEGDVRTLIGRFAEAHAKMGESCLLYTSPSPRRPY